jgi:hypothetical protein
MLLYIIYFLWTRVILSLNIYLGVEWMAHMQGVCQTSKDSIEQVSYVDESLRPLQRNRTNRIYIIRFIHRS